MNSKTYYNFLQERISSNKSRLLLQKRDGWSWKQITWLDFETEVMSIASFLYGIGFSKGEKVAVISHNTLECLCMESAIFLLGGVSVPIDVREKITNAISLLNKISPKYLFIGNKQKLDALLSAGFDSKMVERVFISGDYKGDINENIVNYANLVKFGFLKAKKLKDKLEERTSDISSDLPVYHFPSVNGQNSNNYRQISQEMLIKLLQVTMKKLRFVTTEDQFYSYLPYSDSFSKLANYIPIYIGNRGAIAGSKRDFFSDVLEVMPTVMFLGRDVLEEIVANIYDKNESLKKPLGGRLKYIFTDSFPGHEVKNSFLGSGITIIELNELTTYDH